MKHYRTLKKFIDNLKQKSENTIFFQKGTKRADIHSNALLKKSLKSNHNSENPKIKSHLADIKIQKEQILIPKISSSINIWNRFYNKNQTNHLEQTQSKKKINEYPENIDINDLNYSELFWKKNNKF